MAATVRRGVAASNDGSGLQLWRVGSPLPALVAPVQPLQTLAQEPAAPQLNDLLTPVELVRDGGLGNAIGEQQDKPGPHHIRSSQRARSTTGLELGSFSPYKNDCGG
jgi:hypothetical protein